MYKSTRSALCNQQQMRAECAFPLEFALQLCYPNNLLKETNLRRDKLENNSKSKPQGNDGGLYHEGCRGDIREQVDRHPSAGEDSCRQAGKALAAAPAGGVGPGIVAYHYPSLFKACKALLQVATETLSGVTK